MQLENRGSGVERTGEPGKASGPEEDGLHGGVPDAAWPSKDPAGVRAQLSAFLPNSPLELY